ncbi:hypothetical protein GCM10009096_01850 [Parasphingorhabdus litoris]|uniref:HTH LytTR-type domain-containing protein n=1 Tax=Parasphingorhabdus litoris TaxID=394733 RepID=A0ABN1A118_9SPHN|nr:LytTR family DNA-binding domain-containing protein [Parasphingorhabdus litoris]
MRDFVNLHSPTWYLRLVGHAGLAMLFAGVLAFLAPFGTYRFGGFERIGYWTLQMVAWLVLSTFSYMVLWHFQRMRSRSRISRRAISAMLASIPMAFVIGVSNHVMSGWQVNVADVVEIFVSISLIGGAYTFLSERLIEDRLWNEVRSATPNSGAFSSPEAPAGSALTVANEVPSNPKLIQSLPSDVASDILCLQVEDHYVRAHSSHRSAMTLMRFSDALLGVDHIPGLRVHRSWWVATTAVMNIHKSGRTAQLALSNGLIVPVSRPYLAETLKRWDMVG